MDSCIVLGLNLGLGGFRAETSQPLAPPGSWEFGALTCVPDEQTGAQGLHWVLWALQRIAADPVAEQHHGSSWSFGGLSSDMSLGLNLNSRQGCILFRRLRGSICFLPCPASQGHRLVLAHSLLPSAPKSAVMCLVVAALTRDGTWAPCLGSVESCHSATRKPQQCRLSGPSSVVTSPSDHSRGDFSTFNCSFG